MFKRLLLAVCLYSLVASILNPLVPVALRDLGLNFVFIGGIMACSTFLLTFQPRYAGVVKKLGEIEAYCLALIMRAVSTFFYWIFYFLKIPFGFLTGKVGEGVSVGILLVSRRSLLQKATREDREKKVVTFSSLLGAFSFLGSILSGILAEFIGIGFVFLLVFVSLVLLSFLSKKILVIEEIKEKKPRKRRKRVKLGDPIEILEKTLVALIEFFKRGIILASIGAFYFVNSFFSSCVSLLIPVISKELFGLVWMGTIVSAISLGQLIFNPSSAIFLSKFGRKKTLLIGESILLASSLSIPLLKHPELFFLALLSASLGMCLVDNASLALLFESVPEGELDLIGAFGSIGNVGYFVGFLMSGILAAKAASLAFLLSSSLIALVLVLVAVFMHE